MLAGFLADLEQSDGGLARVCAWPSFVVLPVSSDVSCALAKPCVGVEAGDLSMRTAAGRRHDDIRGYCFALFLL